MNDARPDPVCLFLHIPKTAGTTLKHCIYEQYSVPGFRDRWTNDGIYYFPYGFHKAQRLRFTPRVRTAFARDDLRAVVGHFWFGAHAHIPCPSFYVTLLREPVDRVVSLYHHILGKETELLHDAVMSRGATLDEFVAEFACREVDNDQTRRIAGVEPQFGRCNAALLDRAKRNLRDHFAFVGITERFDESLIALKRRLRWPYVFYLPELVNPSRPPRHALAPETVALVSEHNQYDLALYEHANRLLDEFCESAGDSFREELETFKSKNDAYVAENQPSSETLQE